MRVLPDVPALDRPFDYLLTGEATTTVRVGTQVRVPLHGRRVSGWVVALDVTPPDGVQLQEVHAVRGVGPSPDLVELARWAGWRWAGRQAQFLRTASPPALVDRLSSHGGQAAAPHEPGDGDQRTLDRALEGGTAVLRIAPAQDRLDTIAALLRQALGHAAPGAGAIVITPSVVQAQRLAAGLGRSGLAVESFAADGPPSALAASWARAAAGGRVVVGTRSAAWSPGPDLAVAIVVDEHDEALRNEQAPTWHARDVLAERCRRAGVPLVLISPCPTLEALESGRLVVPEASEERAGWPSVEVVDRRDEDPTTAKSLFSPRLVALLQGASRAVCVLNRTGRSRLSACRRCGDLAGCERCGATVADADRPDRFVCLRCGTVRPKVCDACGSTAFKVLRMGVAKAADELAAILGEPVGEVTARSNAVDERAELADLARYRVLLGTEAVLRRVSGVPLVAIIDLDQELRAPRLRAGEQSMALVARGARVAGARRSGHRLVLQTRLPDHPVVEAARLGNPSGLSRREDEVRRATGMPPYAALAKVSGPQGASFAAALRRDGGVEVLGGDDGPWRVRAIDHQRLCDALARVDRPSGRLRIEVDPADL